MIHRNPLVTAAVINEPGVHPHPAHLVLFHALVAAVIVRRNDVVCEIELIQFMIE
jgi:hypothetical protein